MRIRRALVPLLLVTVSTLAACGGDGDDDDKASDETTSEAGQEYSQEASQDGGDDASGQPICDLLTTDEVAEAVGSPVKEGIRSSGPAVTGGRFDTCVWQSDDPDNPADTATVTIYPNADAADSVRSDDSEELDGIGDQAFADSFASVWVYDGEKSFFTQWYAISGTDEDNLPKSKALASLVADAL